jgi:hypothetical protein
LSTDPWLRRSVLALIPRTCQGQSLERRSLSL